MKKILSAILLVAAISQVASAQQASVQVGLRADGSWAASRSSSDIGFLNASIAVRANFPRSLGAQQLAMSTVDHCVAYETRFDGETDVQVCVRNEDWYQLNFVDATSIQVGDAGGSVQTAFGQRALKTSVLQAVIQNEAKAENSLPAVLVLEAFTDGSLTSSWFTGLKIAALNKSIDGSAYLDFEARVLLQATYKYDAAAKSYQLAGVTSAGSTYSLGALYYERNSACRDNACIEALAPITSNHALPLK